MAKPSFLGTEHRGTEFPFLGNYCEMWSHCLEPPLRAGQRYIFLWGCDFKTHDSGIPMNSEDKNQIIKFSKYLCLVIRRKCAAGEMRKSGLIVRDQLSI